MITKCFERHLRYYTTIVKVFVNGVVLITAYYLVFKLPIGYLISLYIIMFVMWLLISTLFFGKFLEYMAKMDFEGRQKAKFDFLTSFCDIIINAMCYG
jgi:hypothetical protein